MASPLDRHQSILRRPKVTEKGLKMVERQHAYPFEVATDANKIEIRKAVETLFKVKVAAVRTATVRGKLKRLGRRYGRRPDWKRAIVVLREGFTIENFY